MCYFDSHLDSYYPQLADKLNTFQAMLLKAGTSTYACYFYTQLQWIKGEAPSGVNGVVAKAGFRCASAVFSAF